MTLFNYIIRAFLLLFVTFISVDIARALPCDPIETSAFTASERSNANDSEPLRYTVTPTKIQSAVLSIGGPTLELPLTVHQEPLDANGFATRPQKGTLNVVHAVFRTPSASGLEEYSITIETDKFINTGLTTLLIGVGTLDDNFQANCQDRQAGVISSGFNYQSNLPYPAATAQGRTIDLAEFSNNAFSNSVDAVAISVTRWSGTFNDAYKYILVGDFKPDTNYEIFFAVERQSSAASTVLDASAEQINVRFSVNEGSGGGSNVDPEVVRIQPEVREDNCPLSSLEHLNFSIRTEQALKLRLDEQVNDINEALDNVSSSGVNPGPALRALDKTTAAVRKDIGNTRNVVIGGLEFSKRHLFCAKEKLSEANLIAGNKLVAELEIDQAILNDDEAIGFIVSENADAKSEATRLLSTLERSSQSINSALIDKEDAGKSIDPSFVLPNFQSENIEMIFDESKSAIVSANQRLIDALKAQKSAIKSSDNRGATIDAIKAAQEDGSIDAHFDDIVTEYITTDTLVKNALAEKAAEAAARAAEAEAAGDAQGAKLARREEKVFISTEKRVDSATVKAIKDTRAKENRTREFKDSPLVRFNNKLDALLKILELAKSAERDLRGRPVADLKWKKSVEDAIEKLKANPFN